MPNILGGRGCVFEHQPEMFSTERDCVAHLHRIIGSKRYDERKLLEPHPETGACAIRCEWKRRGSDESIDLMVIDASSFKVKREESTKKGGGFGSAKTHVVVEVKGPQINKVKIKKDINKVSELVGNNSGPKLANRGFVVVFVGEELNYEWESLREDTERDHPKLEFYYRKTYRFSNG